MMSQEQMAKKEKNESFDNNISAEIKTGSNSSEELVFVDINKTLNTNSNIFFVFIIYILLNDSQRSRHQTHSLISI